MNFRWLAFVICAVLGLALLVCGLLVPMHLRAVDAGVLKRAGANGPSLLGHGQMLAGERKLGVAQMLVQAARAAGMPAWDRLADTITNLARQNPAALAWGDDGRVAGLFGNESALAAPDSPLADFIIRQGNREAALAHLQGSTVQSVQELLRTRSLKDTSLFPPSSSAAGQSFDTAVCIGGLLLDGNHLPAGLSRDISDLASQANRGSGSEPLEQSLMDFLSLGERFNWDQLTAFVADIPDAGTLHRLADDARAADAKLPVLFAAVQLSGRPADVADYLAKFKDTGLSNLGASLRYGAGGVAELAKRQQQFYDPPVERRVAAFNPFGAFYYYAAGVAVQNPWLALAGKWFLYLLAGFFAAAALHCARPAVSPLERPLASARGSPRARIFIFAGVSAGGVALERAVSRPGKPEGKFFPSTDPAHDGRDGPRGIRRPQTNRYEPKYLEPHHRVDAACVLRAAGAALHFVPRETGGNPPSKCAAAHEAQAAGK